MSNELLIIAAKELIKHLKELTTKVAHHKLVALKRDETVVLALKRSDVSCKILKKLIEQSSSIIAENSVTMSSSTVTMSSSSPGPEAQSTSSAHITAKVSSSTTSSDAAAHSDERSSSLAEISKRQAVVREIAEHWARSLLEVTWEIENALVDSKFPLSFHNEDLLYVQSLLNSFESIADTLIACGSCCDHATDAVLSTPANAEYVEFDVLVAAFGTELAEVIHWRRAALVYMCCATLENDKERRKALAGQEQVVDAAIQSFYKMMLVHEREESLKYGSRVNERKIVGEEEVVRMTSAGLYSDTNLLAFIYCSSLCLWRIKCFESVVEPSADEHRVPLRSARGWIPPLPCSYEDQCEWLCDRYLYCVRSVLPQHAARNWRLEHAEQMKTECRQHTS